MQQSESKRYIILVFIYIIHTFCSINATSTSIYLVPDIDGEIYFLNSLAWFSLFCQFVAGIQSEKRTMILF
jgi:hypothetical protein